MDLLNDEDFGSLTVIGNRAASGKVINRLSKLIPNNRRFTDLAPSTKTIMEDEGIFPEGSN